MTGNLTRGHLTIWSKVLVKGALAARPSAPKPPRGPNRPRIRAAAESPAPELTAGQIKIDRWSNRHGPNGPLVIGRIHTAESTAGQIGRRFDRRLARDGPAAAACEGRFRLDWTTGQIDFWGQRFFFQASGQNGGRGGSARTALLQQLCTGATAVRTAVFDQPGRICIHQFLTSGKKTAAADLRGQLCCSSFTR